MFNTFNNEEVLERISDAYYLLSNDLKIKYINNITEKLLHVSRKKVVGKFIYEALPNNDINNFVKRYKDCLKKQMPIEFEEFFNNKWYEVRAFPSKQSLSVFYRDITVRKLRDEKINYLANYDVLTEVPNRYFFSNSLNQELQSSEKPFTILFIDLDRFKNVNDTFGHEVGDILLKQGSVRLKKIINPHGLLARYSGDEFLAILRIEDKKQIEFISQQIIESFFNPFLIKGYEIKISVSIGISQFPMDGRSENTLIRNADMAMYQAKRAGRNIYKFYSFVDNEIRINRLKMEMELHNALNDSQLFLHYQPKVSLKTGTINGVEALIRWEHPEWGLISPGSFIPVAEDTGLIIPIGEWALYTACKQNKLWQQQGFSTVVSVNLSPKQFSQSNFIQVVSSVLQKTKLEPHFLELEITESMTADSENTILTLHELKKIGVRISVDDFGTGFSSLSYIKNFPIDTLKIDQSFVRGLKNNPKDETIVKTIISMAHNLNLNVVAEGIETKEQLIFLQKYLCDEGQGYFLSKPLPEDKIKAKISEITQIVEEHGISRDINERMWMEELLRLARRDLQTTVRLQQGMIFKFKKINEKFIHTLCDGELLYRLGKIPSEVIGKGLKEFLPGEQFMKKNECYKRAWEGEEFVSYEGNLNGIKYLATLRPVKQGGEVIEVIGSCVDITEQKLVEEALRESEWKYRLITENMTDFIMLLDKNGIVLYGTPSLRRLLGYSSKIYQGQCSFDFIHPEDKHSFMERFNNTINKRTSAQMEVRFLRSDGNWLLIEGVGTPVISENNDVEHFLVVGRDITDRRKAEELQTKADKLKIVGELAAGVAHEIRNPLTSIKGFIQLFQQGIPLKKEHFDVIFLEFNRIEEILKEFVCLAKPQEIHFKMANIKTLLKEVVILLKPEANMKNVVISMDYKQNIPQIMCDINQIKQVFINILKNSIDAITTNGYVKIEVSIADEEVLINIIDNGKGISKERLQRIGEPFYSNKEKGIGLGLMLCFRILRQHNGSIIINSKEDLGTSVEIRLPLKMN